MALSKYFHVGDISEFLRFEVTGVPDVEEVQSLSTDEEAAPAERLASCITCAHPIHLPQLSTSVL